MRTQLVASGSARLSVQVAGAGPLAVLVHGFPLDHRMWTAVMDELASARTLAALDLRGHGRSPWAADEVHSMELLADDVAAVIARLAPDGRADVVGLSMGGYVALALWERRRELVRSLALLDTRAGADGADGRAARDAMASAARERGAAWVADEMLPRLLAPGADAAVASAVRAMIEATPIESIVADLRGMRDRPDRTDLLAEIDVPTLVGVGSLDTLTPPAEAERMAAALPRARLECVAGAGHLTPMEAPAACAALLSEHWTE